MQAGWREHKKLEMGGFSKAQMKNMMTTNAGMVNATGKVTRWTMDCRLNMTKSDDNKLSALKAYRRAKESCFKFGEKLGKAHKCSNSVSLHVVKKMCAMTSTEDEEKMTELIVGEAEDSEVEVVLSIWNADVTGSEGYKTIWLWASVQCQQLLILVDSGSLASFVESHLIGLVKGVQNLTKLVQVKVADVGCLWSE